MNFVNNENPFSSEFSEHKTNIKKNKKYESLFINTKEINSSLVKEYNALNFINPKLKNESRVFDLINLLGNKKEFLNLKAIYENENRKINRDIITHRQVKQNLLNFNTVNIHSFDKKKINSDNPIQLSTEDNFIMKMIKYNNKKHRKKFNKNFGYFKPSLSQEDMLRKYIINNSKKYKSNIRNNIFEKLYRNKYKFEKNRNKKIKLETNDPVKIIDNLINNYEKKHSLNNPNNPNNNNNSQINNKNNKNKNENVNKGKLIKNQRRYNSLINLNQESKSLYKSNSVKSINSENDKNIASIKKKSLFSPKYPNKELKITKSLSCDEFPNIPQKNEIKLDLSNLNDFQTIFKEEKKIKSDSEEISNNLLDIKFEKYFNKIKIYNSVLKKKFLKTKKRHDLLMNKKEKSRYVNIKENLSQYKKGLYDYAIVNKYIYGSRSPIAVFRGNRKMPLDFNFKKMFF